MANHQQENNRRQSAIQALLKMFHLSSTEGAKLSIEEELNSDVDEPPDEPQSPLSANPAAAQHQQHQQRYQQQTAYARSALPHMERKESLLTRALMINSGSETFSPHTAPIAGALSRASTFSIASMPSTEELTSDGDDASPVRSASPSPPLPPIQYHQLHIPDETPLPPSRISFVGIREQDTVTTTTLQEAKSESGVARKSCITFKCIGKPAVKDAPTIKEGNGGQVQQPKRTCTLTFACPARPTPHTEDHKLELSTVRRDRGNPTRDGTRDLLAKNEKARGQGGAQGPELSTVSENVWNEGVSSPLPKPAKAKPLQASPFQEFGASDKHDDPWVHEPIDCQHKLTLSECMKKEDVIRKIGREAEEEAEQEDEEDELEETDDGDNEDDFAPSDDGNESDNEAGFAESDDDSDAGSDDQFWVPSNTTAATSVDQHSPLRPMGRRRQSGSSMDSIGERVLHRRKTTDFIDIKFSKHHHDHDASKASHLRPDTPDLPDSTDFVCGTLDEDRPLEAAYISCLEQKKRQKQFPIPQDIDPSFPTTDPEDMDEEDDDALDGPEDHLWLKDQLEGFDDCTQKGHAPQHPKTKGALRSPRRPQSPPPKPGARRSSPAPRHAGRRSSPAPKGGLFGHSPKRLRSPPPPGRLKSPPGTRRTSPTNMSPKAQQSQGLMISRLAQRPHMTGTSSLPHTPNPFFRNYHARRQQQTDRVGYDESSPRRELHVRGPVDIVSGLEKKRQKQKEKYWRQHCRKAAKEQADRKPVPGKGAERMRELGLECAERNRGYGVGQQAALVISL